MHLRKILLVAGLLSPAALAQQAVAPQPNPAEPPAFEAVTIKPNIHPDQGWYLYATPDGYKGQKISLLKLIGEAYGVFDPKLISGGPPWIDSDKFDLIAKFDPAEIPNAKDLTYRQRADMLQAVLAKRFGLKIHRETREFPVYNLVITKSGLKLQETKASDVHQTVGGASCLFRRGYNGYIQVEGCMPKDLENQIRFETGRNVIDKTGITKRYNFELRWTPADIPSDTPGSAPSLFTALQEQLGLKLEPATAPLSVIVIDSAEKPSEN